MKRKVRVLHCPDNVASNPQILCASERRRGFASWLVTFKGHMFGYPADEILFGKNAFLNELKRYGLFLRGLFFYDVIHYNFGMTIFRSELHSSGAKGFRGLLIKGLSAYSLLVEQKDLMLFKFFGKKVFVTFQGDDARQGDFCSGHFKYSFVEEAGYYSKESDIAKRRRIERFNKYADGIYALNPDLLNVLPSKAHFMPYSHIDLEEWNPSYRECDIPHIVHAPSHRGVKGSRFVLEAFEKLKQSGIPFKYTLVEGMTREQAREVYESADLLIDQLLIGWYGGLAVELMALGKPVICYLRDEDLKFIPSEMKNEMPIINANPENIYDVLVEWLGTRKNDLLERGKASRKYVEKWHDPNRIAEKVTTDYMRSLESVNL